MRFLCCYIADDMVLFSTKLKNLVLMLKAMDNVVERFTMCINASKTKIMSVGKGTSTTTYCAFLRRAKTKNLKGLRS